MTGINLWGFITLAPSSDIPNRVTAERLNINKWSRTGCTFHAHPDINILAKGSRFKFFNLDIMLSLILSFFLPYLSCTLISVLYQVFIIYVEIRKITKNFFPAII